MFGVEGPRCHYWRRNTSAQDRNALKCLGAQTVEAMNRGCRIHETWNALCAMPFLSLVLYCSVVMSVVTEMNPGHTSQHIPASDSGLSIGESWGMTEQLRGLPPKYAVSTHGGTLLLASKATPDNISKWDLKIIICWNYRLLSWNSSTKRGEY